MKSGAVFFDKEIETPNMRNASVQTTYRSGLPVYTFRDRVIRAYTPIPVSKTGVAYAPALVSRTEGNETLLSVLEAKRGEAPELDLGKAILADPNLFSRAETNFRPFTGNMTPLSFHETTQAIEVRKNATPETEEFYHAGMILRSLVGAVMGRLGDPKQRLIPSSEEVIQATIQILTGNKTPFQQEVPFGTMLGDALSFSGLDLEGIDFSYIRLGCGSLFSQVDLSGEDLSHSVFFDGLFLWANLREADVRGTTFENNTMFFGADVTGADFSDVYLNVASLQLALNRIIGQARGKVILPKRFNHPDNSSYERNIKLVESVFPDGYRWQ